jgi:hypothetical protein
MTLPNNPLSLLHMLLIGFCWLCSPSLFVCTTPSFIVLQASDSSVLWSAAAMLCRAVLCCGQQACPAWAPASSA